MGRIHPSSKVFDSAVARPAGNVAGSAGLQHGVDPIAMGPPTGLPCCPTISPPWFEDEVAAGAKYDTIIFNGALQFFEDQPATLAASSHLPHRPHQ